jgi:hypothetical protein
VIPPEEGGVITAFTEECVVAGEKGQTGQNYYLPTMFLYPLRRLYRLSPVWPRLG